MEVKETKEISSEELAYLLNEWYKCIRAHELLKAEGIKSKIYHSIKMMDEDKILIYYTLLEFRHKLMTNHIAESKPLLSKVEPFKEELCHLLTYYYHFFQGMYHWRMGRYRDALEQYLIAENLLEQIPDQLEKAEFHYRVANVYYNMGKNMLSIQHIHKAQDIFSQDPNYRIKMADCENILGINCIDIKQYEEAEQHLITTLDIAQKNDDLELMKVAKYNLGYLYSEQRLSEAAIRHLTYVHEKQHKLYKTIFLLTREYFRLHRHDKAHALVKEGLEECHRIKNTEYIHHFNILDAFHLNKSIEEIEHTVNEGITFFKKEDLWYFVREYAEQLAKRLYDLKQHEKVSHYFHVSYEAKEYIIEKEALK